MKRVLLAVVTMLAVAITAGPVLARQQDWERIRGVIQSRQSDTLLILKADDGRVIGVDTSQVSPNVVKALTPGERVEIAGVKGDTTDRFMARFIQQQPGSSAASASAAQGSGAQQWERIRGVVQSRQSDTLMILKADDGRVLGVDTSQVRPNVVKALEIGERVEVAGVKAGGTDRFMARYIQQDPGGAASPGPTKR